MLTLYPFTRSLEVTFIASGVGAGIVGGLAFLAAYIYWILVPAVVMLEPVGIIEGLRRSRLLVKRSFLTAAAAVAIMFMIPGIIAGSISYVVNISAKALDPSIEKKADAPTTPDAPGPAEKPDENVTIQIGRPGTTIIKTEAKGSEMDMRTKLKHTLLESLIQLLWLPMQILVFSFSGIIVALLYLKTRRAGGESMNELIERFEDDERPRKKWQERVRQRLIQSGRIPSNP
jgi:hypothetical protein